MKKRALIGRGLIEIEPIGVAPSADETRPLVLFKEVDGERVLPVWVSHLDAGITMIQNHSGARSPSPHDFTIELLGNMDVTLESCEFNEIKGHHQFAKLNFKGSRKVKEMRARADHVLSLCLYSKCRFFTTFDVLKKSQTLDQEMSQVAQTMKLVPERYKNPSPFLN